MARVPTKQGRDQPMGFQGFLNNLQDWELSLKDQDKNLKTQSGQEKLKHGITPKFSPGLGISGRSAESREGRSGASQKSGIVGEVSSPVAETTSANFGNYDAVNRLSSSFMEEDSSFDANSEKDLGNEYFKQKKFKEAIDCYSRSIGLSPTAVAYANRAMAYLKVKRLREAEDDCTEALNLDDRYTKAYMRRSTARKELGKLKDSIDDAEFALRLEPQNQEIKKQYAEAKSLYEKEILKKAAEAMRGSPQEVQKEGQPVKVVESVPYSTKMARIDAIQEDRTKVNNRNGKRDLKASVQELAARAASLATMEAAKNITPPTSAYQFEVSWRGLSGDQTLQARLLKVTSPFALPQIFKNALSASLLMEIVRCTATFFIDDVDLAVKYLQNLSMVSRFDTIIMCLSSTEKADLLKLWDEVFCSKEIPAEYSYILSKIRPRYCTGR